MKGRHETTPPLCFLEDNACAGVSNAAIAAPPTASTVGDIAGQAQPSGKDARSFPAGV